jgi:hypothetical protein
LPRTFTEVGLLFGQRFYAKPAGQRDGVGSHARTFALLSKKNVDIASFRERATGLSTLCASLGSPPRSHAHMRFARQSSSGEIVAADVELFRTVQAAVHEICRGPYAAVAGVA